MVIYEGVKMKRCLIESAGKIFRQVSRDKGGLQRCLVKLEGQGSPRQVDCYVRATYDDLLEYSFKRHRKYNG